MKFSINQNELQSALSVVAKASSSRASLPILSGVMVKAEAERVTLEATDLTVSTRCALPALVEEEGEAVLPATLFLNVVKKLPNAAIHLKTDQDCATVLCDTTSVSLKTFTAQDFPGFPIVQEEESTTLPFDLFARMVRKVERVVAVDEMRPVLTGVLVEVAEDKLKLVATDSYRLSIMEAPHENTGQPFKAVIPGAFLKEVSSLPQGEENIHIGYNENQILITYGTYTFINRRIEGTYPDYNQLIPKSCTTKATIETKKLIDAVDRTSLLSNKTTPVKFDLNIASQTMHVSTSNADVGAASDTVGAEITGEDIEIAFNFSFVLDGLRAAESSTIDLELENSQRPGIFKTSGDEQYTYLVMPVRIPQ